MEWMFGRCSSLKEINRSNFNTKNETHIVGMFNRCSDECVMKIKSQYKIIK